ncbi:MAG: amidohydrolase family protein [Dehalobacter sp.]|nr:amidohydrolase family protein [Dehalobacter sp.]
MKIITIEEHINNREITAASFGNLLQMAPYVPDSHSPGLAYYTTDTDGNVEEKWLASMDAGKIDMQVLSYTAMTQLIPAPEAISIAKAANNEMAERVRRYPDRFAAFATLPWADPKAAAEELERTVKELNFKGVLLSGRPAADAIFLDNPKFEPVLAMANFLKVPIYMHPGFPARTVQEAYYAGLDPVVSARLSAFGWGWHAEVGVHMLRMILSGVFVKYPNLQLIAGHWGEMVPFFLARLDEALSKEATHLPKTISETFINHVYVTPSGMFTLPHFQFILQVLGADRIIFSVDYPYIGNESARAFLENAPISASDKEKIAHGNAERLLKL